MKLIVFILFLLVIELSHAKCAPNKSNFYAEIQVETCSAIEEETSLLITGKLKSYFEHGLGISESSVVDVEEWEIQPNQNFVWKQKSFHEVDCRFFSPNQLIQVSMWEPCCNTNADRGAMCQDNARWIRELPIRLNGHY